MTCPFSESLTIKEAEEMGIIYTRHYDDTQTAVLFPEYLRDTLVGLKPGTVLGLPSYDKVLMHLPRYNILSILPSLKYKTKMT